MNNPIPDQLFNIDFANRPIARAGQRYWGKQDCGQNWLAAPPGVHAKGDYDHREMNDVLERFVLTLSFTPSSATQQTILITSFKVSPNLLDPQSIVGPRKSK